jgi:short-subunit dehydrogenase
VRQFIDHTAVITGAASGIGRQLAVDLVERGAAVFGVDVDEHALKQTPGITALSCDLSDREAFQRLLAQVETERGQIDILANVAGIDRPVCAAGGDVKLYESVLQVNFLAPLAGTLAVLPGMVARGHGYVVNVSSDSVRAPIAGASAYIASKGAVTGFSESAALELKDVGVHIHVLYPGFVYSAMGSLSVKNGMKKPPRMIVRTPQQISALTLQKLGGRAIEINATRVTLGASIIKMSAPRIYRRMMASRAMPHG